MNQAEFNTELEKLHEQYAKMPDVQNKLELIELRLKLLLQDYLWEANLGIRTLNKSKYRQLSIAWHPDKLKDKPQGNFLKWYMEITRSISSPFQALSFVKECYRPELHYRAQDAQGAQAAGDPQHFYFVSNFARISEILYSICWPVFYLFEALERNIDNYTNPKAQYFAKRIYHFFSLIPLGVLSGIMFVMSAINADIWEILSIYLQEYWLGALLINGTLGFFILMFSMGIGLLSEKRFPPDDKCKNDLILYLLALAYAPVVGIFNQLRTEPNNGDGKIFFYLKKTALTALLVWYSMAAALQIFFYGVGLSYAAPFFATLLLFPFAGLLLVNIPLLISQTYHQPKQAADKVAEYLSTIFNRYYSIFIRISSYLKHLVATVFQKIPLPRFWQQQRAPEANNGPEVFKPNVNNMPDQKVDQNNKPAIPYWQAKIQKYSSKDNAVLLNKRRSLKQQRNALLKSFGISDLDAFYEKLETAIGEKSIPLNEKGFVETENENMVPSLEILNFKAQILFLKEAKTKNLRATQLAQQYPNDLDYHTLINNPKIKVG